MNSNEYANGDVRWQKLYANKIRDSSSLRTEDIIGASPHKKIYDKTILREQYMIRNPNVTTGVNQSIEKDNFNMQMNPTTGEPFHSYQGRRNMNDARNIKRQELYPNSVSSPIGNPGQSQNVFQKGAQSTLFTQGVGSSTMYGQNTLSEKDMGVTKIRNPLYTDFNYEAYKPQLNQTYHVNIEPKSHYLTPQEPHSSSLNNYKSPKGELFEKFAGKPNRYPTETHPYSQDNKMETTLSSKYLQRQDDLRQGGSEFKDSISNSMTHNNKNTLNDEVFNFYDVPPTENDHKRLKNMNLRRVNNALDQMKQKSVLPSSVPYDKLMYSEMNSHNQYEKMKDPAFKNDVSKFYDSGSPEHLNEHEHFKLNYDQFYRGYTPQQDKPLGFGQSKVFNGLANSRNPYVKRDIYTFDPIKGAPMLKYQTGGLRQKAEGSKSYNIGNRSSMNLRQDALQFFNGTND